MLFSNTSEITHKNSFSPEIIIDPVTESDNISSDGDYIVYQAMADSFSALYHSICCKDVSIVQEGFKDFINTVWEFFKNIAKSIANFIKNVFNYLASFVMDFEKFIEKYKDNVGKFREFEVNGYNYTIDSEKISDDKVQHVISEYNGYISKLKDKELVDVEKHITEQLSKEELNKIRGELAGTGGSLKPDKFEKEMAKKFRDGKSATVRIKVDHSTAEDFISSFQTLKGTLEDVKEDGYNIHSLFDDMANFFRELPSYDYDNSNSRKKIDHYNLSADTEKGNFKAEKSGDKDYSDDYYKKLNIYYNFCFRMCKSYAAIYNKAYSIKIAAIKEAMEFYKTTLRRALSPFADKEEDSDKASKESLYLLENAPEHTENYTTMFNGLMEKAEFDLYFEQMKSYIDEVNYLGKWYGNALVMMEDVELKDRDANQDVGFFKKLIEFIKTIFAKFKDKASNLFNSNEEWFQKYSHKVSELDASIYNNIKITLLNYEKHEDYKNPPRSNFQSMEGVDPAKLGHTLRMKINNDKKVTDTSKLLKAMYSSSFLKLGGGDITEATKTWYRGENNTVSAFTGNQAKEKVAIMMKYCTEYKSKVDDINEIVEQITTNLEKADEAYEKLKESTYTYSNLEGDNIESTGFAWLPWYDPKQDDFLFPTYEHTIVLYEGIVYYNNNGWLYSDKEIDELKTYIGNGVSTVNVASENDAINADASKAAWKKNNNSRVSAYKALINNLKPQQPPTQPQQPQQSVAGGQNASVSQGAAANNSSVSTAANANDSSASVQSEEDKKAEERKRALEDLKLAKEYYSIRIKVFTATISVMEERYVNYIKTLRNVVALAGISADRNKENAKNVKK